MAPGSLTSFGHPPGWAATLVSDRTEVGGFFAAKPGREVAVGTALMVPLNPRNGGSRASTTMGTCAWFPFGHQGGFRARRKAEGGDCNQGGPPANCGREREQSSSFY